MTTGISGQTVRLLKKAIPSSLKPPIKFALGTLRQPAAMAKNLNEYRYGKQLASATFISYTPKVFIPTITNACNLRCPSCLYLLENSSHFTSKHMSAEDFDQILAKYNARHLAETICLTGGEPLVNPEFDKIVDSALRSGADVNASTNGILLSSRMETVRKMRNVNVSLDAFNQETFKLYRGGSARQFDSIIDGLHDLSSKGVSYSLSFLLSMSNLDKTQEMLDFAQGFNPSMIYFHNINPHGIDDYVPLTMDKPEVREWISELTGRTDYSFSLGLPAIFDTGSKEFATAKCMQPWTYFCFDPNGDVSYCCHLEHSKEIGNVFDSYDLNSSAMQEFRGNQLSGNIPDSCKFCHRRFSGREYAFFDAASRLWQLPDADGYLG